MQRGGHRARDFALRRSRRRPQLHREQSAATVQLETSILLGFGAFTFLMPLLVISSQPKRRKYQKADASADRTGIVWPRSAQEAWISVVTMWDDRDRRARLERRPTATAVIENEVEHAVSVGNKECGMQLDTAGCVCRSLIMIPLPSRPRTPTCKRSSRGTAHLYQPSPTSSQRRFGIHSSSSQRQDVALHRSGSRQSVPPCNKPPRIRINSAFGS